MRKLIATLAAAGAAVAIIPSAGAFPHGGPGPNTPGTKVVVTSASGVEGGAITFDASGFAPNATFFVKLDDGKGYSHTDIHGRGTLTKDRVSFGADGSAKHVTVWLPCLDLTKGQHWLRVLSVAPDKKRYTSRSVNTFAITPSAECHH